MFKEQCCLIILSFLNIIVTVVGLKQSRKKVQKLNYEKVFASLEVSLGKNIGKQLVKTAGKPAGNWRAAADPPG